MEITRFISLKGYAVPILSFHFSASIATSEETLVFMATIAFSLSSNSYKTFIRPSEVMLIPFVKKLNLHHQIDFYCTPYQ